MPRAGLSTERVVAEAALLVDEVGRDALTLAALAARLGVRLPSLYKHVGGLDDVHRRLAALAVGELADATADAVAGRARGDALRALADVYRGYARAHPGRYAETLRAARAEDVAHVAAAERLLGLIYRVLEGYGIAGDDLVDATRALRATLHGFVDLEVAGGFGLPQSVDRSFARAVGGLERELASWAGA